MITRLILDYGVLAIGFSSQALFGIRLLVQWMAAERRGLTSTPKVFWVISLAASFLLLTYGLIRVDPVIIVGQFLSYYIYVRNLQFTLIWKKITLVGKIFIILFPMGVTAWLLSYLEMAWVDVYPSSWSNGFLLLGFSGQLLLNVRFVYQWIYLEKTKKAILPLPFWWISGVASVLVLFYAFNHPVYGIDPVLVVAQLLGILVYARAVIIHLTKRDTASSSGQ